MEVLKTHSFYEDVLREDLKKLEIKYYQDGEHGM